MAADVLSLFAIQAYDQQQQGLVDAASKALSYRQNVLEENIRLTYALQVFFLSYLLILSSLLETGWLQLLHVIKPISFLAIRFRVLLTVDMDVPGGRAGENNLCGKLDASFSRV